MIQDKKEAIANLRRTTYKSDRNNFDDVCLMFHLCPSCLNESASVILLPIIDKERFSQVDVLASQKDTLARIFDAEFDFLHEEAFCNSCPSTKSELRTVVYCYFNNGIDFQNFIFYPFEKIETIQAPLRHDGKQLLFIDTETTGLPINWRSSYRDVSNWPRLVQIAWIISNETGEIQSKGSHIIRPDNFEIPLAATQIHRISNEHAKKNGEDLRKVLTRLNEFIRSSDIVVAHNVNFDVNVLASEYFRLDIDSPLTNKHSICTMERSTNYCAINSSRGYKWPTLSELHFKLFNKNFDEAHDAGVDIEITHKCFFELNKINVIKLML